MDNSTSLFERFKQKLNSLYNTAKGTPEENTRILPAVSGGSRKTRSNKRTKRKGTKRVRFSKKHRVYTVRRYKK